MMSHMFQVDDDTFMKLALLAQQQHKKPEDLFNEWLAELRIQAFADTVYYDEASFEHEALGMSDADRDAAERLRQQLYETDDANV